MIDRNIILVDDLDNTTVRLNNNGKVEAVINRQNIPEKEFVTGSKVLAFDPSGNLYQFGQKSDYFKDGALSLYTSNSELLDDGTTKHTVEFSITNTRDVLIPTAIVTISTGNTVSDFAVGQSKAEKTEWDGSTLTITNIPAYGNVSGKFFVVSSYNDYVSASLTIDGDVEASNNHTTLNLQRKVAPVASSNVYTKECPVIKATYDGAVLNQSKQSSSISNYFNPDGSLFINMIDQTVLNGASMMFNGATSVRVFISHNYYMGRFNGVGMISEIETNKYRSWGISTKDYREATLDDYVFSDGSLTFMTNAKSAIVYARTGGAECMWQKYYIGTKNGDTTLTVNDNRISVTGLDQQYYRYLITGSTYGGDNFKDLPYIESSESITTNLKGVRYFSSESNYWNSQEYYEYYMTNTSINASSKLIIEIPKGTQVSFKIDQQGVLPNQQGAVWTDSGGNVVVSADATATDSIYTNLVDIIIV